LATEGPFPWKEASKRRPGADSCATRLDMPGAGWPIHAILSRRRGSLGERGRPHASFLRPHEVILAMRTKLPTNIPVFIRALEATPKNLGDIARVIGVSRRTMSRYVSAAPPFLSHQQWNALADEVRPHDAALAQELVAMGNVQAFAHGLAQVVVTPPQAAPPAAQPAPPPQVAPKPQPQLDSARADAVVYAAAEALDASPRQLRPAIAAAFARAVELGCTCEQIAGALTPKAARKPEPPAKGPGSAARG
jgi:hypothetical protein